MVVVESSRTFIAGEQNTFRLSNRHEFSFCVVFGFFEKHLAKVAIENSTTVEEFRAQSGQMNVLRFFPLLSQCYCRSRR